MKKSLLLLIAAVGLLFSCSNIFDKGVEEDRNSSDGGTYLVIGSASVGRTIDTDTEESYLKKLTGLVLTGIRTDADGKAEAETPLAEANSLAELTKDGDSSRKIPIQTGTWSFTLTANLDDVEFSDTLEGVEIKASENNKISFNLEAQSNGGINITVQFYDTTESLTGVTATLTNVNGTETIGTKEFAKSDFTDAGKDEDEKQLYSVTYTSGAEGLASGTYHLVFDFYAEGTTASLNSPDYLVRVSDGITTKATQTILLNETYTITYEMNGGVLPEGKTLPGKYSRKSETISLPVMKDNENTDLTTIEKIDWVFDGWYTDSEFTKGNEISEIPTGTTGDLTLYAKWYERKTSENGFTVSINVNQSDIEVENNFEEAIEDKIPEITFTAPTEVDGNSITSYEWSLDGTECGSLSTLTLDASNWVSSIYTLSLIAKDSKGVYYSYIAQIDWTRLYNIEFNTENNPSITTIPSQYVREGDGITFAVTPTYGWYTDAGFTTPFNDDDKPTSNLTLYGCWDLDGKIYVSEDGADPTDTANSDGRGTAGRPFASISAALELVNDAEKAYTIFIDGELTGAQELGSSLDEKAKSITLSGKNGSETDILNGGFKTSSSCGTTLTISTTVPVTIQKLTITGGNATEDDGVENGGGIVLSAGASLTLDEDSLITENTASVRGAGIYAQGENIIITINSGAKVTKNDLTYELDTFYVNGEPVRNYDGGAGIHISGDGVTVSDTTKLPVLVVNTGAEISENKSPHLRRGAGVQVKNAKMEFNGGKITKNISGDCAANMYVDGENSLVTMTDGEISHGQASYAGGLFVNGGNFTMSGGKICNNIAGNNGNAGGVRIGASGVFEMTGGEISDNYINNSSDRKGGGVYLDNAASTFKIGGNAVISSGATIDGELVTGAGYNDVYLAYDSTNANSAKITILGELTGTALVATVTPADYNTTTQWLEVSNVTQEGMTSTTLENEYGKFAVTPTTGTDAAGSTTTTNYLLTKDGKLVDYNTTASTVASYIENMSESGTVRLAGAIDTATLTTIRDALMSLYKSSNTIEVDLDLSYATGLTSVPSYSFYENNVGCQNLTSVLLPEGVTSIGELAFCSCTKLTTINIPSTVTTIYARAFNECSSLANVTLADGNKNLKLAEDGAIYTVNGTKLVMYGNKTATGTFAVPNTVTEIGTYAFSHCNFESVTFGADSALTSIGGEAFLKCRKLASINLPDNVSSIGHEAFMYCSSFTSITLPESLTAIATQTFNSCSSLTTVTIPVSVKEIGNWAFESTALTTVNYKGTEEQKDAMTIASSAFNGRDNVTWVYNYKIGSKTAPDAVGDIVFNDGSAIAYTDGLTLTADQKAAAVAVIFYVGTELNDGDDTTTSRTLGVGLKQQTGLAWCTSDANANSVNISTIQCMPSGGSEGAYTFETTADKNGSDNLSQIGTYLSSNSSSDDTGTEANYPAFYFAKNYASSSGNISKNSTFAENWYLPSFAELVVLYNSKSTVNGVLSLCEGTSFGSTGYWTSSQHTTAANASVLMFNMGIHTNSEKTTNSTNFTTCVIREF